MKCPHCHGRGVVTRRFLFITWQRPCGHCDGTGRARSKSARLMSPYDDRRDDDFGRSDYPSSSSAGQPEREAEFVVGAGGRSGGAGGGASWGDEGGSRAETASGEAPLIVDPFAADAAGPAGDAPSAEAEWSAGDGEATSDSGSASDGGTAY